MIANQTGVVRLVLFQHVDFVRYREDMKGKTTSHKVQLCSKDEIKRQRCPFRLSH